MTLRHRSPHLLTPSEYYERVFSRLARGFEDAHFVLGYGPELTSRGWDPKGLLVTVEPTDNLWDLAVGMGLEVFLPVMNSRARSVLVPFDFEVFLGRENHRIYHDIAFQKFCFEEVIWPAARFIEELLAKWHIHYVLDLTPSGGHFLFRIHEDDPSYQAMEAIGWLEPEVSEAYQKHDPSDLKRDPAPGFRAGSAFSGISRLSTYIGFLVLERFKELPYPITIGDTHDHALNMDLSWASDPGYMRIIRAPFSLHKKNIHRYHRGHRPLVDVMATYKDGHHEIRYDNVSHMVDLMWDLEAAADHAHAFTGHIPIAGKGLARFAKERYQPSDFARYLANFDLEPALAPGEALHRFTHDPRPHAEARRAVAYPYPALLQPKVLKRFVAEMVLRCRWSAKHVGDLILDCYNDPSYPWGVNWAKYIPRTRAYFWARTYAAQALYEHGELAIRL